jgi:two-component system cell cycle response regulator DivK
LIGDGLARRRPENLNWRRVPVVAVSAFSMPGDREKAFEAGFDGYLSKPITPQTFVHEIADFLPPELRV